MIVAMSQSATRAMATTRIMPPLCQAPSRILALDQRPSLAAAALPISQSASISSTQATTSQPNHPHTAVNAATPAATAALIPSKVISSIVLSFPSG